MGKVFSPKNCLFALNRKEKHSEEQKKDDRMKVFRQEAIRKKASKQKKAFRKKVSFPKGRFTVLKFEKESFPLVQKRKGFL